MKILNEPRALKEIHELRLENYEQTKNMTISERNQRVHESTRETMKKLGIETIPLPHQDEEKRTI